MHAHLSTTRGLATHGKCGERVQRVSGVKLHMRRSIETAREDSIGRYHQSMRLRRNITLVLSIAPLGCFVGGCTDAGVAIGRFLHNPLGRSDGFVDAPSEADRRRPRLPILISATSIEEISQPRALDLYRPGPSVCLYEDDKGNRQTRVTGKRDNEGRWTVVIHEGDRDGRVLREMTFKSTEVQSVLIERFADPGESIDLVFNPPMRFAPVTMSLGPKSDFTAKVHQVDGNGPSADSPVSVRQVVEVICGDSGGWPDIKVVAPGEPWIVRTRLSIDIGLSTLVRTSIISIDPERGVIRDQEEFRDLVGLIMARGERHDWKLVEEDRSTP